MSKLNDAFLIQLKKENQTVTIYLVNGIQLKGTVKGFDNFTIFLENQEKKIQLVYKHSVTTINPLKQIEPSFLESSFKDIKAAKSKKETVAI
ncbi:MAG: RNA chaperone Hfq [Armatimonadetes bacterium]|nr:RNA chaperone Hfq [Armatimonadota bacterium]